LPIDFAGEFLHSFSILRFGYSIPASEEGRGVDASSDFGGKPAPSQIFSPLISFPPSAPRARAARPYNLELLFFVFLLAFRHAHAECMAALNLAWFRANSAFESILFFAFCGTYLQAH